MNNFTRRMAPAIARCVASLLLAGCATFSPDGGMDKVAALTRERTGLSVGLQRSDVDVEAVRTRVDELLKSPLTPDGAVEIALLNNRGLQADLAGLGIAEADFVQAGRLRNPTFGFGRLAGGGIVETDRSLMFVVHDLLTLPAATGIARQRFEQAQYAAAARAVALASETRKAWVDAVSAQQLVEYAGLVKDTADASADLARRMAAAGNFSKLDQMREQAFHADSTSQLAHARQRATTQREKLTRLLGLGGEQLDFTLPNRLPDLPAAALAPQEVEQTAMNERLDVQLARRATAATASALGLTQATRFVNALDVGWQNKDQTGAPHEDGFQLEVELPIFDFGAARKARAEAQYMQAVHRTAQVATDARSQVREAYSAYRTSYDLAGQYRDEVVPLRKRIADENLLRYNGMLISVFELIADAREQVAGVTGYVEALRDFWLADADLRFALVGGTVGAGPDGAMDAWAPSSSSH